MGKKQIMLLNLLNMDYFITILKKYQSLRTLFQVKSKNYYVPIEDENLNHLIYKLNYVLKEIEGLKKL